MGFVSSLISVLRYQVMRLHQAGAAVLVVILNVSTLFAADTNLAIPKIGAPLSIDDFSGMRPLPELAGKLAIVEDFIQSDPTDGARPSQKTVVYMAYDDDNVYVIFAAFDSSPEKIRASLSRREAFSEDEDWIEVYFDTFNDQRRAYCFSTNALGIQWDSRYSETSSNSGFSGHQPSFDALWYSEGRLTNEGYLVWMAIPFKSLRFPPGELQKWRVLFGRSIPRTNEYMAWPHVSRQIQGMLTQSSSLTGLQDISPGKSIQFIPYSSFRSFRLLNTETTPPAFITDRSDAAVGLDAKLVLKDSFVFDLALNPDFSQVESDEPQVTVNQRFEVFFREKRPFFLENAQYFETPLNLVFTRRIGDPQWGARLTGKTGPYTMGVLFMDDQAPGKQAPGNSVQSGEEAYFGLVRLTRDLFSQSYVGVLLTHRTFTGTANSVVGADFKLRLNDLWQATGQAVHSWNDPAGEGSRDGGAYHFQLIRAGRKLRNEFTFNDLSPDFETSTGFIPRVDYRSIENFVRYHFRPEGKLVVAWGPGFTFLQSWDQDGTRLDSSYHPSFYVELQRRTFLQLHYVQDRQRLRVIDFPVLAAATDFFTPGWGADVSSAFWTRATLEFHYTQGKDINFVPPEGEAPSRAESLSMEGSLILRPAQKLQLRAGYLFTALKSTDEQTIFNDHIASLRSNYQFSRELSLRVILQYEATIANAALTSLENRRNLNADVLITYLVNPWTALYVGFNGNRQNLSLIEEPDGVRAIRSRGSWINDANQLFVKFSYLLRF